MECYPNLPEAAPSSILRRRLPSAAHVLQVKMPVDFGRYGTHLNKGLVVISWKVQSDSDLVRREIAALGVAGGSRIHRCWSGGKNIVWRFVEDDHGGIAVLVAVTLPVLLAAGALGVDISRMYGAQKTLQTTADVAATAGAREIPNGCEAARQAIRDYASAKMNDEVVSILHDVAFGHWDEETRTFEAGAPGACPSEIDVSGVVNAVRVYARESDEAAGHANPLNLALLPLFRPDMNDVTAVAIAANVGVGGQAGGIPSSGCVFTQAAGGGAGRGASAKLHTTRGNGKEVVEWHPSNVKAIGPMLYDFDGDDGAEVPILQSKNHIRLFDNPTSNWDHKVRLSGKKALTKRTMLAVGTWNATGNIYIFYSGSSAPNRTSGSQIFQTTISGSPEIISGQDQVKSVAGPANLDSDNGKEFVFADGSQMIRYMTDRNDDRSSGYPQMDDGQAKAGINKNVGLGVPARFDNVGGDYAVVPIVDDHNNFKLSWTEGSETVVADGSVAKSPVCTSDLDRDDKTEIAYISNGDETAGVEYVDDVGGENEIKDLTDKDGNQISAKKATGILDAYPRRSVGLVQPESN